MNHCVVNAINDKLAKFDGFILLLRSIIINIVSLLSLVYYKFKALVAYYSLMFKFSHPSEVFRFIDECSDKTYLFVGF